MALEHTLGLLFFIRKDKVTPQKKVPIYLRITVDGSRIHIATKRYVEAIKWDSSAGRVKGNKEEIKQLNTYLDTLRGQVYKYQKELIDNNEAVAAHRLKAIYCVL